MITGNTNTVEASAIQTTSASVNVSLSDAPLDEGSVLMTTAAKWSTPYVISNSTGDSKVAIGFHALDGNTTGTNNIAIGNTAGTAVTTGSHNIYIGNNRDGTDDQVIRIGSGQTTNYIAGIFGSTMHTGDHCPVYIDAFDKLHTGLPGQAVLLGELCYKNATTDTRRGKKHWSKEKS
jgi:hypothetical protein